MDKSAILLTGITGFLGSHIAEYLSANYFIIGVIRSSSDLSRYNEIKNTNIRLVNIDDPEYKKIIQEFQPNVIIHCAWSGVSASDRDEWETQIQNISYTYELLKLSESLKIKRFICLGSQAEYGVFDGRVDEQHECKPTSAYGASKMATLNIVETYCNQNQIPWYWLRIFPMYGTREALNWFIPSVIKTALENGNMDLTSCEQRYGYLYVTEFCRALEKIIISDSFPGVYNLASDKSIQLRSIVELIINKTQTKGIFKFGTLPYRKNQVMHMEGNSEKYFRTFNFIPNQDFETNIEKVIKYYRLKYFSHPGSVLPTVH